MAEGLEPVEGALLVLHCFVVRDGAFDDGVALREELVAEVAIAAAESGWGVSMCRKGWGGLG